MHVSTPPSLDLACPQAKAEIEKYVHMFRDRGADKIKYGHEGIMIIYSNIYCHIISYANVTIRSQSKVWIRNFFEN